MALLTGYATIAEANATLGTLEPWNSATDPTKQAALDFGRLYLDTNYTCVDFDKTTPPTDVKDANAYLANAHLLGRLFKAPTDTPVAGAITKKKVKAGSVESETEYATSKGSSSSTDPSPEATAILAQAGTCTLTRNSVTRNLIRA